MNTKSLELITAFIIIASAIVGFHIGYTMNRVRKSKPPKPNSKS